jgi:hypothetical protein
MQDDLDNDMGPLDDELGGSMSGMGGGGATDMDIEGQRPARPSGGARALKSSSAGPRKSARRAAGARKAAKKKGAKKAGARKAARKRPKMRARAGKGKSRRR